MLRRIPLIFLFGVLVVTLACTNKKVSNPLADVGSKQPDKVLFDRAMDAMKHNRFDVARLTLQTLINTYPDSEYIARAKLSVADSWYAEGGSTSLAQAEIEYKDFKTFFPNMPEAAEAQLKVANIHYQQMEKPDRDYTHAMRAEEEYRALIMEFPDSKLVPEAKQRLREVQEVIGEREFRVGRFYHLRESYPAAIARLQSLVDKYPLFSKADEALYLLGQSYEGEIAMMRARPTCVGRPGRPPGCMNEGDKARMLDHFTKGAADAYSRIITRYPVMDRADDAKARLQALHQTVPRPTKAAIAQNKAEEDSRRETKMVSKMLRTFAKHPDVAEAAKVGEPTLVDPTPVSASEVVQQATRAIASGGGASGSHSVTVETVGHGAPPPDQPAPRSDAPAAVDNAENPASADTSALPPATQPDSSELKPNAPADANELRPNVPEDSGQALPPPQQVNQIPTAEEGQQTSNSSQATENSEKASDAKAASTSQQSDEEAAAASSKHKKKKGIHKLVPF